MQTDPALRRTSLACGTYPATHSSRGTAPDLHDADLFVPSQHDAAVVDFPKFSQRVSAHFREGEGDINPDWARRYALADGLLSALVKGNGSASFEHSLAGPLRDLEDRRLGATRDDLSGLVDQIADQGILERKGDEMKLKVDVRLAATKLNAVRFIRKDLSRAIGDGGEALRATLLSYAQAQKTFDKDPVESKWPVLLAATTLPAPEQEKLKAFVRDNAEVNGTELGDAISLMLGNPIPKDWLNRHAPNLVGRAIVNFTAEGLFGVAGGLGRVMQYHTEAMQQLAQGQADLIVAEPMYSHRKPDANGEEPAIDWSALARAQGGTPPERAGAVTVDVRGKQATAELFTSRLSDGRIAWLIRDPQQYYAHALYTYPGNGKESWSEFSEFFTKASEALLAEHTRQARSTRAPVVVANDTQALPILEMMDRRIESGDEVLKASPKVGITHTILNRFGEGVEQMGIPESHSDRAWHLIPDVTSIGLRSADLAAAVSSPQKDQVEAIDPKVKMIALTNGTTIRSFHDRLSEVGAADPYQASPLQIELAKQTAKLQLAEELGIPEGQREAFSKQMLISNSGRCVGEKLMCHEKAAFTEDNLRAMASQGANVVLYANVQNSAESQKLFETFQQAADRINAEGHAGRIIVRTGWGQPEQLRLLEATDLQIQHSESRLDARFSFKDGKPVATEASGYTEAPAHNFAALQMGPVEIHGTLNTPGTLVDWNEPGSGSILEPREATARAYRDEIVRAIQVYNGELETYRMMGRTALQHGRINQALLTAAEYLRAESRIEK